MLAGAHLFWISRLFLALLASLFSSKALRVPLCSKVDSAASSFFFCGSTSGDVVQAISTGEREEGKGERGKGKGERGKGQGARGKGKGERGKGKGERGKGKGEREEIRKQTSPSMNI
jgi:hypothetical protein